MCHGTRFSLCSLHACTHTCTCVPYTPARTHARTDQPVPGRPVPVPVPVPAENLLLLGKEHPSDTDVPIQSHTPPPKHQHDAPHKPVKGPVATTLTCLSYSAPMLLAWHARHAGASCIDLPPPTLFNHRPDGCDMKPPSTRQPRTFPFSGKSNLGKLAVMSIAHNVRVGFHIFTKQTCRGCVCVCVCVQRSPVFASQYKHPCMLALGAQHPKMCLHTTLPVCYVGLLPTPNTTHPQTYVREDWSPKDAKRA